MKQSNNNFSFGQLEVVLAGVNTSRHSVFILHYCSYYYWGLG